MLTFRRLPVGELFQMLTVCEKQNDHPNGNKKCAAPQAKFLEKYSKIY